MFVVISIVAVLSGLALPSFTRLIAGQRSKAIGSELFIALNKARSEAVKRNANVTLSAKTGGWSAGWRILDPADATRVLEDRDAATGATVTGPTGPSSVTFTASGRLQAGTAASFLVTTLSGSTTYYQCIAVDLGGKPYMKGADTC